MLTFALAFGSLHWSHDKSLSSSEKKDFKRFSKRSGFFLYLRSSRFSLFLWDFSWSSPYSWRFFFVFCLFLLFQEVYRDFSVELSSPNNDKDGVDEDKNENENSKEDDNDGINNKSNINVNSNDNNIHNNNNTNDKGNSKDNKSNSIDSEVNDVIILPNTPEGKMIPISQYLCNTQDKEKMKTKENLHEYGDEHEKSHKKRENLDERRYKKKPLRLENLLKSFFLCLVCYTNIVI